MATAFEFGEGHSEIKERANQWLARFAPLVSKHQPQEPEALHKQLKVIDSLRAEESKIRYELGRLWEPSDQEVRETFEKAAQQLSSIESEVRSRISALAPGDPEGLVNLDDLQERLAEREARQELGMEAEPVPVVLHETTRRRNVAAGLGIGVFGMGWTAFTTIHCILMIGGMMKAMGLIALFMLLFYSIFFMVGFGMLYGALLAMSEEKITLRGREITIEQSWGAIKKSKSYILEPNTFAKIDKAVMVAGKSEKPANAIILTDINGKRIQFALQSDEGLQRKHLEQINRYLQLRG
jgi:hypothetical protein